MFCEFVSFTLTQAYTNCGEAVGSNYLSLLLYFAVASFTIFRVKYLTYLYILATVCHLLDKIYNNSNKRIEWNCIELFQLPISLLIQFCCFCFFLSFPIPVIPNNTQINTRNVLQN